VAFHIHLSADDEIYLANLPLSDAGKAAVERFVLQGIADTPRHLQAQPIPSASRWRRVLHRPPLSRCRACTPHRVSCQRCCCGVWFLVTLWCLAPFVWAFLTATFNLGNSSSSSTGSSSSYSSSSTGSSSSGSMLGPMIGYGGGGLLLMLFLYAVWCSAGVICGVGIEKAVLAAADLAGRLRRRER
jgi:hypothetical protein